MSDLLYLKRRKQTWYVCLAVPEELRRHFENRVEIVQSLRNRDLRVAQEARWLVVAGYKETFRKLADAAKSPMKTPGPDARAIYKQTIEQARAGHFAIELEGDARDPKVIGAEDRAYEIGGEAEPEDLAADVRARIHALHDYLTEESGRQRPARPQYAMKIYEVATEYLKSLSVTNQTRSQYDATVRLLPRTRGTNPWER